MEFGTRWDCGWSNRRLHVNSSLMTIELPEWLEYYMQVPAWVLFKSVPENRIYWVNESLAESLDKDREWFVGKSISDIWTDSRIEVPGNDRRAVEENKVIDAVSEGRDVNGEWRWLDSRFTPVGKERVLIIIEDITARIKLAGLRLVLGRGLAGESRGDFGEEFAQHLLEGASLDSICKAEHAQPAEILAKLGRLVGESTEPPEGIKVPLPVDHDTAGKDLPDWLDFYWTLPGPVVLLDYPPLTVLWVNQFILERNEMTMEQIVGIDGHQVWANLSEWLSVVERTMRENRSIDSLQQTKNLRGRQQWMAVRTLPLGPERLLVLGDDVTAAIRLQALRLLLGLNPVGPAGPVTISDAFARLLLGGATVGNICAALELSQDQVLGQATMILGHSH
jgi:hypothetical protein